MKNLIKKGEYNAGRRPSEHKISETSFLTNHNGSIAHNVLEIEAIEEDKELRLPYSMLSISNTKSNDYFMRRCREEKITPHPARMPLELASLEHLLNYVGVHFNMHTFPTKILCLKERLVQNYRRQL